MSNRILFVTSEVYPYRKSGGLAEVSEALPKALRNSEQEVITVCPKYDNLELRDGEILEKWRNISIQIAGERETFTIYRLFYLGEEVPVYFLGHELFFQGNWQENPLQEGYALVAFNIAVLEMLDIIHYIPDIIHCNDWHTGPLCFYLKEFYSKYESYQNIKTLFTIHNLAYQGVYPYELMAKLGLSEEYFVYNKIEFYGKMSFIKMGLIYSDAISTVSETHAKEILTLEDGCGLDGVLRERKAKLYGILNGIDQDKYNPRVDEYLSTHYDEQSIESKRENKLNLLSTLGFEGHCDGDYPVVISMIGRLVEQKGFDILVPIIPQVLQHPVLFVIMGSGQEKYENEIQEMQRRYPEHLVYIRDYSTEMAHMIYGGSDICLMPSRFEPCGISQMISMGYGTIPIVRRVGGLADSVRDVYEDFVNSNGFVFDGYNSDELLQTILNTLNYYEQPFLWKSIMKRAMTSDFSWDNAAHKYISLYRKMKSSS